MVLDPNAKELIIEEPDEDFNIMSVQTVPVYPGCESEVDNSGRRKCMSEKIGKLIRKKFNGTVAEDLGLSSGTNKIDVFFKINKEGNVEILKTRGHHVRLEKEAKRVINKIPTMTPGMNNDKSVNVTYCVPIKFNVQN